MLMLPINSSNRNGSNSSKIDPIASMMNITASVAATGMIIVAAILSMNRQRSTLESESGSEINYQSQHHSY